MYNFLSSAGCFSINWSYVSLNNFIFKELNNCKSSPPIINSSRNKNFRHTTMFFSVVPVIKPGAYQTVVIFLDMKSSQTQPQEIIWKFDCQYFIEVISGYKVKSLYLTNTINRNSCMDIPNYFANITITNYTSFLTH